jgi:hypothetical protein
LYGAFSPDNDFGFQTGRARGAWHARIGSRVSDQGIRGDRGRRPGNALAVYVPTNQLYLGDLIICRPEQAAFPDLTVEQGIRIFFDRCGMALPSSLHARGISVSAQVMR